MSASRWARKWSSLKEQCQTRPYVLVFVIALGMVVVSPLLWLSLRRSGRAVAQPNLPPAHDASPSRRHSPPTPPPSASPTLSPPPPWAPPHTAAPLGPGTRGPEVLALEQRLVALNYMVGAVDGVFDAATAHAVIAFQKVEGLGRTGAADAPTIARLGAAAAPAPATAIPPDHLEVDLARQVVLVVRAGKVAATLATSTGSGSLYRHEGRRYRADTPMGTFSITWKYPGWRDSRFGRLYKPSYFNDKEGVAFHGYPQVPPVPASRGCVRLPMVFADWFYDQASPVGMTVVVYGAQGPPSPSG